IQRILHIATNPGDLVLDSFLGSGTTAAVAHKMGRRWVGIEMGEHAETHCLPRLKKVIEGEQGGISQAVNWQGGGGFRFMRLGEPMFNADGSIHAAVRFNTLAGFVWMQETGLPLHTQMQGQGQRQVQIPPNPPLEKWGTDSASSSEIVKAASAPHFVKGGSGGISPLLGVHEGRAIYLLFNGILGDKRPASGNVLTHEVLAAINQLFPHDGEKLIYGEACRLGEKRLAAEGITFKHIPYDVKAR
ncbi:MAG: DNA methyltransferase, partial [Gallionellaceae bacterium]